MTFPSSPLFAVTSPGSATMTISLISPAAIPRGFRLLSPTCRGSFGPWTSHVSASSCVDLTLSHLSEDLFTRSLLSKKNRLMDGPPLQMYESNSDRLPSGQACLTCRKRKLKCDGFRPCCSFCTKRSLQCIYDKSLKQSAASREYVNWTCSFDGFIEAVD